MFTLFYTAIWALLFYNWNRRNKNVPIKFKIQHALFTFVIVCLVDAFKLLGWGLKNYKHAFDTYNVTIGFIPGYIIALNQLVYLIIGILLFFIGINLTSGKYSYLKYLIRIIPFYLITSLIEVLFELKHKHMMDTFHDSIIFIPIMFFLCIGFYLWMFLFYNSKYVKTIFNKNNL